MRRVLVVDDSAFMRRVIKDIIEESGQFQVVAAAKNGREALEKIRELQPEVITLDVEMPIMDGLTTLQKMAEQKINIPVIMLSSLTTEGADATLNALELGAVDFISKPESIFNIEQEEKKKEILSKINIALSVGQIHYSPKQTLKKEKPKTKIASPSKPMEWEEGAPYHHLISIGTSTGGPRALQTLLTQIPGNINASLLVVQHMPAGFTKSLAERLDGMCQIGVKEAAHEDVLKRGMCYIAPGNHHIRLQEKGGRIQILLDEGPQVSGHRPSVDVLMEESAKIKNKKVLAAILTGMGADGAKGIKKVKEAGGYTIAQDESTCVVYGMPKSAVAIDAIERILPIQDIANELSKKAGV